MTIQLFRLPFGKKHATWFSRRRKWLETMTWFLNGRSWRQTVGETRCHRRCRVLPREIGSRDRTRKRSTRKDAVCCSPLLVIAFIRSTADCIIFLSVIFLRKTTRKEWDAPFQKKKNATHAKCVPIPTNGKCISQIHYKCTQSIRTALSFLSLKELSILLRIEGECYFCL